MILLTRASATRQNDPLLTLSFRGTPVLYAFNRECALGKELLIVSQIFLRRFFRFEFTDSGVGGLYISSKPYPSAAALDKIALFSKQDIIFRQGTKIKGLPLAAPHSWTVHMAIIPKPTVI